MEGGKFDFVIVDIAGTVLEDGPTTEAFKAIVGARWFYVGTPVIDGRFELYYLRGLVKDYNDWISFNNSPYDNATHKHKEVDLQTKAISVRAYRRDFLGKFI